MVGCTRARWFCAALVLVHAGLSHADSLTIDLETAISRARTHAPSAAVANARIVEARAGLAGARVVLTQNAEVQVGLGPRLSDPRTLEVEAQITQPLELGRRGRRIAVATAEVEHAAAERDAALRELDLVVATAYGEARHADLLVELGARAEAVAQRAATVAERRRKAGDITDLDLDLAKVALGRARSAVAMARSDRAGALGRLASLIGARPGDAITLAGAIVPPALRTEAPARRADVVALAAESRVARAEEVLANALGRPDLGLWFSYERDDADTVLVGGLTFTLPLWNRAHGAKAAARAKQRRIELETTAVVAAASRHVADATDAYARAREAVEVFERDVLPPLVDAEQLLERSIDTGQIAISDYLVARGEIQTARREHLDRQLAYLKAWATARYVGGGR
jgi:outer membrane protein, heavy metal efflux system